MGASETAAVAKSPVPRPVRCALAGSIVNSSGCSSKYLNTPKRLIYGEVHMNIWRLITYPMRIESWRTQSRTPSTDPQSGPLRS